MVTEDVRALRRGVLLLVVPLLILAVGAALYSGLSFFRGEGEALHLVVFLGSLLVVVGEVVFVVRALTMPADEVAARIERNRNRRG